MTTVTYRRRLDNLVLRWQARLDSEWSDRVLPWASAGVLFIILAALSLAKARSLDGAVDLASYTQSAWLITNGAAPITTFTSNTNLMAQQAAFIFYPIAFATYVLPIIPVLLLVQAAALALAVVPIWKISRRLAKLRVGAAATLMFVYATYPVMHNLNLDGFHPEVIAVPGLLAAFYLALTDRWRWFAVFAAVVILSRADLGLAVAGFGGLLILEGKRRAGLITIGVALGWTVVCSLVIQPAFGDGTFAHVAAFSQFGDTPLSVLWGMLTHPLDVTGRLFREESFQLAVVLFAPVLFLPVFAPRYLLPLLPLELFYLVADVPHEAVFGQQTVAVTAVVFLATAFSLGRIGRMGVEKVTVDKRVLGALLFAGAAFFIQSSASSPYREPWAWGSQDVVDAARLDARDHIPADASVRASPSMAQILAERRSLYPLDTSELVTPAAATDGVDVIVIDESQAPRWSSSERDAFAAGILSRGFHRVSDVEGIQLFERDGL